MNSLLLSGSGIWDNLTLLDLTQANVDSQTVAVRRVYLDLDTNDVGIQGGGTLDAWADVVTSPEFDNQLDAPVNRVSMLPGTFELNSTKFGGMKALRVESHDPEFNFMATRVFMDDVEITSDITRIHIEIDAIGNVMEAWIKYQTYAVLGIVNEEVVFYF